MDKYKLIEMKKRLVALGLAGVMLGATGCNNDKNSDEQPPMVDILPEHSHPEEFYKYVIIDGQATKSYDSTCIYLLFDKETYEVTEYLFKNQFTFLGEKFGGELYDLESEKLLVYSDGIATSYNDEYFDYLIENNYLICITEVSDYVEGQNAKEYYTLEEIRELEPQIAEGLKIINNAKVGTK